MLLRNAMQPIRNALSVVMELSQLIGRSPRHTLIFRQCKQQLAIGGNGVRPICCTRWTVQTAVMAAIKAVFSNYAALKQALQLIGESSYDDNGRRASGLLSPRIHDRVSRFGGGGGRPPTPLFFDPPPKIKEGLLVGGGGGACPHTPFVATIDHTMPWPQQPAPTKSNAFHSICVYCQNK